MLIQTSLHLGVFHAPLHTTSNPELLLGSARSYLLCVRSDSIMASYGAGYGVGAGAGAGVEQTGTAAAMKEAAAMDVLYGLDEMTTKVAGMEHAKGVSTGVRGSVPVHAVCVEAPLGRRWG